MANDRISNAMSKVILEYQLNSTSIPMIWDSIATAPGLAAWFADDVTQNDKTFTFSWGKHECRTAVLVNCRQNTYVRFHWEDEMPGSYFEIRIIKNELTGTFLLEVTDFAEPGDEEDVRSLWNTSMDNLYRCGL